ncbi:MAG: DEAD/DEAH box helicase [Candidatus Izemoplasmataceae bacterium]
MTFQELKIIEPILKALTTQEYFVPTPIQAESIPVLLQGKDILGSAQTGTGKTAAFAIPILQNLHLEKQQNKSKRTIKALVLAPTRELALQIHDNFKEYGRNLDIKTTVIYGGVPQSKQVRVLNQGIDILVATPGRLLDLIQQRKLTLSNISYLVLDEADRMLDMGFVKDVKKIVSMVKKERQTMFFSATMPNAIMSLAKEILDNPVRIMVSPEEETIDKIKQSIYYVEKKKKINLLVDLLKKKELKSVLVFSRTKHGANRIVKELDHLNIRAEAIHGNKSQGARQRALALFKAKRIRVLVATDIAARGIDVDELSHVINYDLPDVAETYIHRIGRTGRAGLGGSAISFCSQDEADLLKDIQKHIKMTIAVEKDSVYSIELTNTSFNVKNDRSSRNNKPTNHSKHQKSYSRKRTKNNKVKPKNFSKYDSRNQSKHS